MVELIDTRDIFESLELFVDKKISQGLKENTFVRLGTVTEVADNIPQIRFDGEESATGRRYPCSSRYFPEIGDRVWLIKAGNTWIIVDKIV